MYEVQVWYRGHLVDTAFVETRDSARSQVEEFMLAYKWDKIELIYPPE